MGKKPMNSDNYFCQVIHIVITNLYLVDQCKVDTTYHGLGLSLSAVALAYIYMSFGKIILTCFLYLFHFYLWQF